MRSTACDSIDAITHALPRAVLRSGARFGLLSLAALILRGLELGAMPEHGVHDDGESAGKRNPCFSHGRAPGNVERPLLERERAAIAGEHDIGGLIEQRADPSIATLRDAAGIVDLAGLIAPWHQSQIGPDIAGSPEAVRFVCDRD